MSKKKEKTMKLRIVFVILALVILTPFARADSLTTTGTVTVSVGCWNPAVCGDPAAYWNALGLPVPAIEPPSSDFAPYGDPPLFLFSLDASGDLIATPVDAISTPEPTVVLLLAVGLLVLVIRKRLAILDKNVSMCLSLAKQVKPTRAD
jgi:hypothetical protein